MAFDKYDLITRCRVIFICSILMMDPYFYDEGNTFFEDLYEFVDTKTIENSRRHDLSLLLHTIRFGKKRQIYDSEKNKIDLCNLLMEVNSNEKYIKLLDSVSPEQVDAISKMVPEFIEHVNSNRNGIIHVLIPQ